MSVMECVLGVGHCCELLYAVYHRRSASSSGSSASTASSSSSATSSRSSFDSSFDETAYSSGLVSSRSRGGLRQPHHRPGVRPRLYGAALTASFFEPLVRHVAVQAGEHTERAATVSVADAAVDATGSVADAAVDATVSVADACVTARPPPRMDYLPPGSLGRLGPPETEPASRPRRWSAAPTPGT